MLYRLPNSTSKCDTACSEVRAATAQTNGGRTWGERVVKKSVPMTCDEEETIDLYTRNVFYAQFCLR